MKRAFLVLLGTVLLTGMTACAKNRGVVSGNCNNAPETCRSVGACPGGGGGGRGYTGPSDPVPPNGSVTYPYYTLHGPRDFLSSNPRSIGP